MKQALGFSKTRSHSFAYVSTKNVALEVFSIEMFVHDPNARFGSSKVPVSGVLHL